MPLVTETRSMLVEFFSDPVFSETRSMLGDLDRSLLQAELVTKTYRLKKLLELLDCLKSETYQYLQRE